MQAQGADAIFRAGHPAHSAKPHHQRFARVLKEGADGKRGLIGANEKDQQVSHGGPAITALAAWANEVFNPAQLEERFAAGVLNGAPFLKVRESLGVFV